MNTPRSLLALTIALLMSPLFACDSEGGDSTADYRAVGHIDLVAVASTPWVKDSLHGGDLDTGGPLDACGKVLRAAKAITFGGGEQAFEVYVQGPIDAAAANACGDQIEGGIAGHTAAADEPHPEALLLADDLFVVFAGDLSPSRARMRSLRAADPSPKGSKPIWVVATADGKDDPVEHVQAWLDPRKGLDAHVEVQFDDASKAAEIYGEAMLGLAALRMSDDLGDLVSAVDLDSSGNTITAEVHATPAQIEALTAKMKAQGHGGAQVEAKVRRNPAGKHEGGSVQIQIGSSSK